MESLALLLLGCWFLVSVLVHVAPLRSAASITPGVADGARSLLRPDYLEPLRPTATPWGLPAPGPPPFGGRVTDPVARGSVDCGSAATPRRVAPASDRGGRFP